jgi:hypothetical protein
MTKTFTILSSIQEHQHTSLKANTRSKESAADSVLPTLPSKECVDAILRFSQNINVSPSKHLGHLIYLKS